MCLSSFEELHFAYASVEHLHGNIELTSVCARRLSTGVAGLDESFILLALAWSSYLVKNVTDCCSLYVVLSQKGIV